MNKIFRYLIILFAGVLLVGGVFYLFWDDEEEEEESVGEYHAITIKTQDYSVIREFTVAIETEQPANIRPQVSGRITQICVKEGAKVKKGQTLFILDQVPYQAAVRNASAGVNSAKAQLVIARQTLEGKELLYQQHVIGDFELNKARNEVAMAEAELASARAYLENAQNDLSYTVVKSPSDGVLSMINYRIGELVDPSIEEEMATVTNPKHIYAYLGLSEKTIHDMLQYYSCTVDELPDKLPEVTLTTYWGKELEYKGHINAISGNVEEGTGAVTLRASFENPDVLFRNGSNGILKLPYIVKNAIVIPQEATFDLQDKYFVFKVKDGVARSAEIEVMPYNDGQNYVVTKGLAVGDVIISEGVGLLREGMKVKLKN